MFPLGTSCINESLTTLELAAQGVEFATVHGKRGKSEECMSLEHDPQKSNPLLRQGHAQVFELAHVLIDQPIPPDRIMLWIVVAASHYFT
jgi:hypothetical protein